MDDTNVNPTDPTTVAPVVEETIVEVATPVEGVEVPAVEETTTGTEEAPVAEEAA